MSNALDAIHQLVAVGDAVRAVLTSPDLVLGVAVGVAVCGVAVSLALSGLRVAR